MFKDQANIVVTAGKGGNGIVAFRREKYVPLGGPSGGDGGKGGSVFFVADESVNTLLDFSFTPFIKAFDGQAGMSKNKKGKNGEDVTIKVPVGTQVYQKGDTVLLYDFVFHGQQELIAHGGIGGRGNVSFKTHNNPAPKFAENGDLGESFELRLELKIMADVGLVGMPNAGKSTLISVISNAKPEIASYPFTTLTPNLGLVYVETEKSFVMADLPGLIEGASSGAGLGYAFLRHIERCSVLLHLVSMDPFDYVDTNPYEAFIKINNELKLYNPELLKRPMLVCGTKMDSVGSDENFQEFKEKLKNEYQTHFISAIANKNLNELKRKLYDILEQTPKVTTKPLHRTYTLKQEEPFFTITLKEDGIYELSGEGLHKIFLRTDFNNEQAVKRFARQLRSYGIDAALKEKGVKAGDEVRIFGYLFEMKE